MFLAMAFHSQQICIFFTQADTEEKGKWKLSTKLLRPVWCHSKTNNMLSAISHFSLLSHDLQLWKCVLYVWHLVSVNSIWKCMILNWRHQKSLHIVTVRHTHRQTLTNTKRRAWLKPQSGFLSATWDVYGGGGWVLEIVEEENERKRSDRKKQEEMVVNDMLQVSQVEVKKNTEALNRFSLVATIVFCFSHGQCLCEHLHLCVCGHWR